MPKRTITTEVRAIEEVPGGKMVTIVITQPVPLPQNLSSLTLGTRARGKALWILGIVDVAADKVRMADIRRFTRIEESRLIVDRTFLKKWRYKVLVQNEDVGSY